MELQTPDEAETPTVPGPPEPERIAETHVRDSLMPGSQLGRYLVLEELGRGGVGVVVSAYDPELQRRIAIKVLQRSSNRAQLLREAQTLAQLNHPNVVSIHDVGPFGDGAFIAMEYVDGTTLAAWLRVPRTQTEILEVFLAAARGLSVAHEAGITHRDFKPSNVMLGTDGRVRVTDFGLAHSDERSLAPNDGRDELLATRSTKTGAVMGTPAYMAPEQFRGSAVDPRADQFSFCVALWEALCSERPFCGARYVELRDAVTSGQRRPPPPNTKLPTWLRRALERGLSHEPGLRFASMRELIEALETDPRPRRRRVALLASLGLCVGAVLGARTLRHRGDIDACHVAGEQAVARLDPSSLAAIDESFARTTLPFADSSRVRALAMMRSWTESWRDARTATCVAVIDGALSPEHATARTRCLDEQAEELATLVELFTDADAQIVRAAIPAAARLPRPERCARPEVFARYVDVGRSDPRARELHRALARIDGLLAAERNEEARDAATSVLADAEALDRPALVHRSQLGLGLALVALDEHEPARDRLREAYFGALAAGVDHEALDAAIALIGATSRLHAEYELAHRWAEAAASLIERLGLQGSALDARRLEALGNLQSFEGSPKQAVEAYERAYALRLAVLPDGHPDIASSRISLGTVAADIGDDRLAREHYAAALELQRASLGPEHPHTSRPMINLGNLELRGGQYETAIAWYERAREVLAPLGQDDYEATVALQNMGAAWFYLQDHERALAGWEKVLAIRSAQLPEHSPDIGELLVNIATCRSELGDSEGAIADLRRSLAIFETSFGPEHARVAAVLNNLGVSLRDVGRREESIEPLTRALEIRRVQNPDTQVLAQTQAVLARAHFELGHADEARVLVEPALRYFAREPGPQLGELTARTVEFDLLWVAGDHDEARRLAVERLADPAWARHGESLDAWLVEHGGPSTTVGAQGP